MLNDLRYALRSLRRSPVFSVVAILSLALGIGANTAIFSLLDQALLRSLPVRDPGRLVVLHAGDLSLQGTSSSDNHESVFSVPMYREFSTRTDLFSGVIARAGLPPVVLQQGSGNDYVSVELVSGNYFETLGVQAMVGRTITSADDVTPGAHPVVVLPHSAWMRRFGGDPAIVNRTIRMNGRSWTVLGVLPPRFFSVVRGGNPAVIVPLSMQKQIFPDLDGLHPEVRWVNLMARLRDGITREGAAAAVQSTWHVILEERLAKASPADKAANANRRLELLPAAQGINDLRRQLETPLLVLMSTAAFVLLIACVNLAGLLMARAAARQRDIAIRLSFGASRGKILTQSLLESLILSLLGGVLGLALSSWLTEGLLKLSGGPDSVLGSDLDWRVMLFAFLLSLLTAIVFGSVPAWQTLGADVANTLKKQSTTVASSHARVRKLLVAAQVALATLLLFGAGLFARSLSNLMKVDPGFRTEQVTTFLLSPRQAGYDVRRGNQLYSDVLSRIRQIPGVTAAGGASPGPMTGSTRSGNLTVQGYMPPADKQAGATQHAISPGWRDALRIPLFAGRDLTDADREGSPKVVLVNEAFARRYCQGAPAIGRRIAWGVGDVKPDIEIIGVIGNVHSSDLRQAATPAVYMPYMQEQTLGRMTFYVRSASDEKAIASHLRQVVKSLDPDLPVYQLRPLQARIDEVTNGDRALALLCTAFGVLAVLLTAIGIYGVIAWTVARRTNEIAVRVALGALPTRVLRLVLREAFSVALAGLAIGIGLALLAARIIESKLFGVAARDPLILTAAVLCTGAMSILAAFLPAWRATRIDPARALRSE